MDALTDALCQVRLTGAVFLNAEFRAPWSVLTHATNRCAEMPSSNGMHQINYHLVTTGQCVAVLPGMEPMQLEEGDLIVFPHGDAHVLASDVDLPTVPTVDLLGPVETGAINRLVHGGDGERTSMICGFLECDIQLCRPLLAALPRVLAISARDGQVPSWMGAFLKSGLQDCAGFEQGGGIVMTKLAELLFVDAVQRYFATQPNEMQGLLAGMRDPHVKRALALLHAQPAHPWTVDELSREVALSRSALASRFVEMLGQPPMSYLASRRMQLAAHMLRTTRHPVAAIAEETGYESEPSFHRAFKREFGVPPAAYRRSGNVGWGANAEKGAWATTASILRAAFLGKHPRPDRVPNADALV